MPISRPRAINGPIRVMGAGPAMGQYISGLMAPRPTPKTAFEGASQAAQSIGGALALGLMERKRQNEEAKANTQLRSLMSSGSSLADWQKAYDALPDSERDPNVGGYLNSIAANQAIYQAMQQPKYEKFGSKLVRVNPDGTTQVAYEGDGDLTGDAANLASILGRKPTLEELQDFKDGNRYQAVTETDAYGNQRVVVLNTKKGTFGPGGGGASPRGAGPGASPVGIGAAPASVLGAAPVGLKPVKPAVEPGPDGGQQPPEAPAAPQAAAEAYDAGGNPVSVPAGVKWQNPVDGRLPDGSLASVQWDKTGRFYRVLGKSVKPDKAGNQDEMEAQKQRSANIVLEDIGRAKAQAMDYGLIPNTGFGSFMKNIPGSTAKDLDATLNTIRANVGFDRLQQMRAASPTGGALGQVSDNENKLLQSVLGSLDQAQSEKEFMHNLDRLERVYLDIVHGKGNWKRGDDGQIIVGEGIGGQNQAKAGDMDADSAAAALIKKYGGGK